MPARLGSIPAGVRWLLAYWIVALATHGSGLYQPMHCDYSCRLRIARDWAGGKALYRETYDNPQPAVFLWLLAIDSPRPALSCYLADTALAAVASAVFRAALLRAIPRLAGSIPLLLIVFSGVSPTFYGGQIAEAPAMWLDVLGLSCFWLALTTGRYWLALVAGAYYLLMVEFRVPSAVNLVAWLPLVWVSPVSRLKTAGLTAMAAAGALLTLGALYVHGQVYGYWSEFLVVLWRNVSYGAINRVPLGVSLVEAVKTLARIQLANTLVGLLLTVSAVVLFATCSSLRRRERVWLAVAGLWLLAALASAFPGGRHYAHYYHLTWPAITLVSMLWLAPLRASLRLYAGGAQFGRALVGRGSPDPAHFSAAVARSGDRPQPLTAPRVNPVDRLACGIVAGALLMGILGQAYAGAKALRDLRQEAHVWNALDEATAFLNRETTPQTPVLVHVWLDWAELYWRVPRPAPSFSIPHVIPRDLYAQWLAETTQALPEWIITDGTHWEPIDGPLADEYVKADRDQLVATIARDYAEVKRIGDLRILRRKGAQ